MQICAGQVNAAQVRVAQVRAAQIRVGQVGSTVVRVRLTSWLQSGRFSGLGRGSDISQVSHDFARPRP